MVLTSLSRVTTQTENNRTIENKINAMLCGKQITGNFTHQMETVLKIIRSKVSSFCKHYYMAGADAFIQVKFHFSYLIVVLTFVIMATLHIRTTS